MEILIEFNFYFYFR